MARLAKAAFLYRGEGFSGMIGRSKEAYTEVTPLLGCNLGVQGLLPLHRSEDVVRGSIVIEAAIYCLLLQLPFLMWPYEEPVEKL